MERSVELFRKRLAGEWLEPLLQKAVRELFEMGVVAFSALPEGARVLLVDEDPSVFLGGFLAGVALGKAVFVGNPAWGEREWEQVGAVLRPDLVWGKTPLETSAKVHFWRSWPRPQLSRDAPIFMIGSRFHDSRPKPVSSKIASLWSFSEVSLWGGKAVEDGLELSGKIMIPTGGSGGRVRFAYHDWASLMASVIGTQAFMGGCPIDACCVLPLYHVSGLMQVLRTFATGGRLFLGDWKSWVSGDLPEGDLSGYSLSLVPTQLSRFLEVAGSEVFLKKFKVVFLGGAPASAALLEQGRVLGLPLSPTYGMTETAAMVAAVQPKDFLEGERGVGRALPHAAIAIEEGGIVVRSESLFQGYFPEKPCVCMCYNTGDTGVIDADGRLSAVRRKDAVIITGGEKVDPRVVEDALLAIDGVTAAHVLGLEDPDWGQRVGVVYAAESFVEEEDLMQQLRGELAAFMVPKSWARVEAIPVDEKGKVSAVALRDILS